MEPMLITRYAQATQVLADSRAVPPPVRQDAEQGTLAWLRAQVSRFSSGQVHAERRAEVSRLLAGLDPAELRAGARARAATGPREGVPTAVLCAALGLDDLTPLISVAAKGYLSGEESREADAAVAKLLDKATISEITVLLQAHAATEGLIANALRHAGPSVEGVLHETLRHDPPLLVMRRVLDDEAVEIDLVDANRDPSVFDSGEVFDAARGKTPHLTFGYGVRPCPASAHAFAIAAGVLEGLSS